MTAPDFYLYEFLYRGYAPGSAEAGAFHVVLAQDAIDPFGKTSTKVFHAMTPEQAATAGFSLPRIITAINTAVAAENAALKARHGDLTERHEKVSAQFLEISARHEAMVGRETTDVNRLSLKVEDLRGRLAASEAAVDDLRIQLEAARAASQPEAVVA